MIMERNKAKLIKTWQQQENRMDFMKKASSLLGHKKNSLTKIQSKSTSQQSELTRNVECSSKKNFQEIQEIF